MQKYSKDIAILSMGQALTSTTVALLASVSSPSGAYLAPKEVLSTVPVAATVLGTLLMIYPASALMGSFGRRNGFLFKASMGIIGGIFCCIGLIETSFVTLIMGTFMLGIFNAFGQYYRFAAIDAAHTSDEKTKAISFVMGAGVIGGILGPFLAGHFANIINATPYAGAFIVLSFVCILLALSQLFLSQDLGREHKIQSKVKSDPHLRRFNFGADFIKASAICAISFAVMTLVMNAAPLVLLHDHYNIKMSSVVMQVHFALMYLPAFFNARIVKKIGIRGLISTGIATSAIGCLLPLWPSQTYQLYMIELGLAGAGWSFAFSGGTLLLAETYASSVRVKAQGINSLFVYSANLLASFLAGAMFISYGWRMTNLLVLPLLMVSALCLRASKKNIESTSVMGSSR